MLSENALVYADFVEQQTGLTPSQGEVTELDEQSALFQEGVTIFNRILAKVEGEIGAEAYSSWFGRLKLASYTPSHIKLSVPTAFLRSWLLNHYNSLLMDLWRAEVPSLLRLDIVVRNPSRGAGRNALRDKLLALPSGGKQAPNAGAKSSMLALPSETSTTYVLGSPLDTRYSFENFIEGKSNRMALAAARAVAESAPGEARFNPLFIHAAVGLGKTHLLQATATAAIKHSGSSKVVYLTAEYFMWRFATAIRDNDALALKEQLRDIDLLIIDDLQFLQGKSIQREFCHLLNLLLDSAKQILVAADRPPGDLECLDARVRSRLQGGVALEITRPDFDMRLEMLRQKARQAFKDDDTASVPDDALVYVAKLIDGSGRDLEGALSQIVFRQSFDPELSFARIDELLGHLTRNNGQKRIKIEDIQRIVARHYNVSRVDLLSTRRLRIIVKPRQVAMYLAKILTTRSLPEIGRRFGGRDHTTVLHAVRKIEEIANKDKKVAQELELLKRMIYDQQ